MVTFYAFLQHEKSKWLFSIRKRNILKENQLKDKYVTNKIEKV